MRTTGIEYPARGQMAFCDLGEPPPLAPTEILLCTHYSGITNGTERHALMAEHIWNQFPGRHGYQHVCTVAAVGDAVRDFTPGDWVFHGQYVGHRGWHVQNVNHSHLCLKLPDDIDRKQCALFGMAGVGLRGVRRFRVRPAQKVWVAGAGLIGQFAAQAARAFGAHVTVTDLDQERLDLAGKLGAHQVLNVLDPATADVLQRSGPYDCIIDACGRESLLLDIHEAGLLASRGVVGCLAVRTETVFHWSMLHSREASIEVSCHFDLDDLCVVLYFVQQGTIQVEPLISHIVSIDQAPVVYATMREDPASLRGVVFDWTH